MSIKAVALLLRAPILGAMASLASSSGLGSLSKRRGGNTYPTCPLGGNPFVALVRTFFEGSAQTTDDCRCETTFGLTVEQGGSGIDNHVAGVRVNFEDDRLACSVEGLSIPNDGSTNRCIQGSCAITEVTDNDALVTWGACILRPDVIFAQGQALTAADCIPAQGAFRFRRNHDSTRCSGSREEQGVTLPGQTNVSSNPGFVGGVVAVCSTV